jgi:hypothetical protein
MALADASADGANVIVMNRNPIKKALGPTMVFAKLRSGIVILLVLIGVLLRVVWFARSHGTTLQTATVLTLICSAFGWTFLAIWQVNRGSRKLGLNRSTYAQFLSGPRSNDPDENFLRQWTLQLCCAILAVVLCVLAIALAA